MKKREERKKSFFRRSGNDFFSVSYHGLPKRWNRSEKKIVFQSVTQPLSDLIVFLAVIAVAVVDVVASATAVGSPIYVVFGG